MFKKERKKLPANLNCIISAKNNIMGVISHIYKIINDTKQSRYQFLRYKMNIKKILKMESDMPGHVRKTCFTNSTCFLLKVSVLLI